MIARILHGFGCEIYANDISPNQALAEELQLTYLSKKELQKKCDIIIISLPLTSETHHLIDETVISGMKDGACIINIARGAIVDTPAVLQALNSGKLGGYASDVYEKEGGIYFYNRIGDNLKDDLLLDLLNHPKVLLTPHQAFATREALEKIAETTFYNLNCWRQQKSSEFEL